MKKETKEALSSLDWAISQSAAAHEIRPDEFTVEDYCEALAASGRVLSNKRCREILAEMAARGELESRKISIMGTVKRVYSRPQS